MKNKTVSVLVHLLAFGSDTLFAFDGEDRLRAGIGFADLTESDLLEFVFRQCSHVDGSEWIEGHSLRSLSVGDVVIVMRGNEVSRYRCEGCGWTRWSEGKQSFEPLA
jgi:hypothetical protein